MICLGIEGTSHTLGIGIVDDEGMILSNEKSMYKPKLGSGIIPNEAAQHHEENFDRVLKDALAKAKLTLSDIGIFSYSAGPGLPPSLISAANHATQISKEYKKMLIPVNHPVAHLEIGRLTTNTKDPVFLYLSGGNTQIIAYSEGRYRVFGETEDIPVGNALDVLARNMCLPMPGGPEIEKLAKKGKYVELPYVVKGMNISFSGILTEATSKIKNGTPKEDLAYSMQETCFSMLTEVTERALAHTEKKEVLLVGGVASNKRLQEMLKTMCEERGARFYVAPQEFVNDNGVMIAWTGMLSYKYGKKKKIRDKIMPNWRVDQVEISWV